MVYDALPAANVHREQVQRTCYIPAATRRPLTEELVLILRQEDATIREQLLCVLMPFKVSFHFVTPLSR